MKRIRHNVDVVEDGGYDVVNYRWECTCRRNGRWTTSKVSADASGARHATRATPKPAGPKVLRDLLRLGV